VFNGSVSSTTVKVHNLVSHIQAPYLNHHRSCSDFDERFFNRNLTPLVPLSILRQAQDGDSSAWLTVPEQGRRERSRTALVERGKRGRETKVSEENSNGRGVSYQRGMFRVDRVATVHD